MATLATGSNATVLLGFGDTIALSVPDGAVGRWYFITSSQSAIDNSGNGHQFGPLGANITIGPFVNPGTVYIENYSGSSSALTYTASNYRSVSAYSSLPSASSVPAGAQFWTSDRGMQVSNGTSWVSVLAGSSSNTRSVSSSINGLDLDINGPVLKVSLPNPYTAYTRGFNDEFAYGTPIYFTDGFNGYKWWMASAPFPASQGMVTTISIASPGVFTTAEGSPTPGTLVTFSTTGSLPTGIDAYTKYYVISAGLTDTTYRISTTPDGAAINLSGTQSGVHKVHVTTGGQCAVTIGNPATITCAISPIAGTPVMLSTTGALPTGLNTTNVYYVSQTGWTENSFSLSMTKDGSLISTTGTQSGLHTFAIYPASFENPYILVSNDGLTWSSPPNIPVNPIADTLGNIANTEPGSYYADPYLCASKDNSTLYCIWLWLNKSLDSEESIMLSKSTDGLIWTTPVEIIKTYGTTFSPNSPSLIQTSTGWTLVAINTGSGLGEYIYSTTASNDPTTGWTAPGAVYNGVWSLSTAVHPLGRKWWHQWTVPVENGGLLSLCADNTNSGGTAWSLLSWDNGKTWDVKQFSAYDSSVAGGNWYRPSICVQNDGNSQTLTLYTTTARWPHSPNSVQKTAGNYHMYSAKLVNNLTEKTVNRQLIRDAVNRNLTSPVELTKYGLIAWDSFNRASLGTTLESGQTWTIQSGAFSIVSNQLSCTTTGAISVNVGSSNYDVEFRLINVVNETWIGFNFDSGSFATRYRFGRTTTLGKIQKVVSGSGIPWDQTVSGFNFSNGDIVRLLKRGPFYNFYLNDRIIFGYYDPFQQEKTNIALQLTAGAIVDNFIVRAA